MKKIISYLNNKISRFNSSKNILKLNFLYHKYLGEKDIGKVGFDFSKKPTRQIIVQETINRKKYKSYLEIGCFHNELFDNIVCEKKIGVDPVSGGTTRKTSDDFFSTNKEQFDCIFIDGLHYYNQVKRDVMNSLKFLSQEGVIFLHDCLPNNIYEQAIPRCQYEWSGDVWKALVDFRTSDDLDTYTCYADHGVGLILKRKNRKKLMLENKKKISNLKFYDYYNNYKQYMNIIEYDELKHLF